MPGSATRVVLQSDPSSQAHGTAISTRPKVPIRARAPPPLSDEYSLEPPNSPSPAALRAAAWLRGTTPFGGSFGGRSIPATDRQAIDQRNGYCLGFDGYRRARQMPVQLREPTCGARHVLGRLEGNLRPTIIATACRPTICRCRTVEGVKRFRAHRSACVAVPVLLNRASLDPAQCPKPRGWPSEPCAPSVVGALEPRFTRSSSTARRPRS